MDWYEVKPCPFCGGDADINRRFNNRRHEFFVFVKCDICGGSGKAYTDMEQDAYTPNWGTDACRNAINAWNMRVMG